MIAMDKFSVARVLDEIARYVELAEPTNKFKAIAFERAARSLRSLDREPADLVESGELTKTPGIGKATGAIVEELVREGRSQYLDDLRAQFPPGIFDLMRVPGFGLKKIAVVYEKLGVGSLDELEEAAKAGRLASLKGFGKKTEEKILEGIEKARRGESRFLLPVGIEVGELIREHLATIEEVDDAEVSGSVRRRLEVIRNVNIVVATRKPKKVIEALPRLVENVEALDDTTYKGLANGEIDVLFHLTTPQELGTVLFVTTGSQEFVEAFGEPAKAAREEEVFERAGVAFVEPERRESADDLKRKRRRKLVEMSDLRGTFHVHTTFSDGRNTVLEMLRAASQRGFEYVGISDHSPAAYYAGGLSPEKLKEQHAEIARHGKEFAPMQVFRGTEADILPDGSIDYGAKVLSKLDFVIASIHSRFNMPKDEMTERILLALDDPYVTFLGHLTGRLLLSRDGYTMDFERVFERAGERGVMIEINGNPRRLDLDWRHVKRALDHGVRFSIHPDAHSIGEYNALISGTWTARKAGLGAKEIFNTSPADEVADYLQKRRRAAGG
jgi:DNA polymerase (family 10)